LAGRGELLFEVSMVRRESRGQGRGSGNLTSNLVALSCLRFRWSLANQTLSFLSKWTDTSRSAALIIGRYFGSTTTEVDLLVSQSAQGKKSS
jgi:hypothetical protein